MTFHSDPPKPLAAISDRPKKKFESILEAKLALFLDKLGCVYHKGSSVFVVTSAGSGTFPRKEWLDDKK